MAKYNRNQIIPIIIILTIIVAAVFMLVSLARILFFADPTINTPVSSDSSQQALLDKSAGREVKMTVRGPIVASEDFRHYTIDITPSTRILMVYKGYDDQQIDTIGLSNDPSAYEQFVYALNKAKFMDGTALIGDGNDTRGVCATGELYDFQILSSNKIIKEVWTTSCSSAKGSLGTSLTPIIDLFWEQVPGIDSKVNDLW
ncbi:hypothetical protein HGB24_00660 [Candidatus Saccharibacteria bacterium]|nr:hypothetical protein [Candidatus Saccharibacteria bacterium]